ncbi:MAG: type IV secretion protein IcmD [Francisellaceae bacterium]|jgi:intracellular multiplication protein IcmD|nr:type IV secretion protein IcmD [Francisellaceae bacterium]MBT6208265.1 type IV secretion protein IcmD [Francisellaceae bacterium]MBT6538261.1 type IV secretion protein IcmD [Francisellaceae bacterium]
MRSYVRPVVAVAAIFAALSSGAAYAVNDLSSIAEQLTTQVKSLAGLLVIVAYVAGIGFALAGVIQFKAHKDNPAQVPLSKPIVYLGVGACLLFLPALMGSAGNTIFGGEQKDSATQASTDNVIQLE